MAKLKRAAGGRREIREEEAIIINPGLCTELGLNMAGEKLDIHLPLSKQAVKEAISLVGKVVEGDGKIEVGE